MDLERINPRGHGTLPIGEAELQDGHVSSSPSPLHVVLRLNDDVAAGWSDEVVVRCWGRLFPPRGIDRQPLEVCEDWITAQLKDAKWVGETRKRLNSLGWFMKCLVVQTLVTKVAGTFHVPSPVLKTLRFSDTALGEVENGKK